jgi:fluoride exporter
VTQALAIATGGAAGALLRFWMSQGVYLLLGRGFPYGTLAVNILGSFLMGLLYVYLLDRSHIAPEWRAAILIGMLGAFTTFSTFSIETLNLFEQGEQFKALMNAVLSVVLCLFATWLGVIIGRQLS